MVREFTGRHLAFGLSLASLGLVIAKYVVVADGDLTTALAVASRSDPAAVALGCAVIALPVAAGILALAAGLGMPRYLEASWVDRAFIAVLYILAWLALSVVIPTYALLQLGGIALANVVVALVGHLVGHRRDKKAEQRAKAEDREARERGAADVALVESALAVTKEDGPGRREEKVDLLLRAQNVARDRLEETAAKLQELEAKLRRMEEAAARSQAVYRKVLGYLTVIAVGFFLVGFALIDRSWLPSESVELRGADPVVGYVVDVTPRWLYVLEDETREMRVLASKEVLDRTVCRIGGSDWGSRPVWHNLFGDPAPYEPCEQ